MKEEIENLLIQGKKYEVLEILKSDFYEPEMQKNKAKVIFQIVLLGISALALAIGIKTVNEIAICFGTSFAIGSILGLVQCIKYKSALGDFSDKYRLEELNQGGKSR